jgi:hypothetical protein
MTESYSRMEAAVAYYAKLGIRLMSRRMLK